MATLADIIKSTLQEAEEVREAGGLSDADMLGRTPVSQRARFLKSIGALDDNPPTNSLDRSSASEETERAKRVQGAARAVNALKSLPADAREQAANAKLPKVTDGDDMTGILHTLHTHETMDEMFRKLDAAGR